MNEHNALWQSLDRVNGRALLAYAVGGWLIVGGIVAIIWVMA